MQCRQCQFENPTGMKFCGQCGQKLVSVCSQCQAEAPEGHKFCGQCGQPLNAAATPQTVEASVATLPQEAISESARTPTVDVTTSPARPPDRSTGAEIKQVTVLCGRVVSEPVDALGPELVHDLLSQFFALTEEEVGRYGGTVSQQADQGFMALFGAPVAFEDHARRAVLAAIDLHERVAGRAAQLQDRHGIQWTARLGLASGQVVVGGVGAMAVGIATTRAKDLQTTAPPGSTLIDHDMARLVRPFVELEAFRPEADAAGLLPSPSMGTRSTPGRPADEGSAQPAAPTAWLLTGLRSELQGSDTAKRRSPFVGRDRELSLLGELRSRAEHGEGQLVAISGEAGAGKSRLLYEHRKALRGRPVSYLRGRCLSFGDGIPYLPLIDMIRGASQISATDESATDPTNSVAGKLRASLERIGTESEESLPYLLRLLGVQDGTEALGDLEPQTIQNRTFATLRRILLDASRGALVIMELEDVHWIDETSEQFLDTLVEVMGAARIMLLLTYRYGYQPRWLEKSYATQITVHRLSTSESRRLVDTLLDRTDRPNDPRRAERIPEVLEKAEGNPLFLEELARSLAGSEDVAGPAIPDTVQGVLMARIDHLPEAQKELLRTASVLGRSFPLSLLKALWQRSEDLEPLLDTLRRQEFLYKTPAEDQALHFFKHALIQEVAYESLLSNRRRELHHLAATTLEAIHADRLEDVYDQLIFHYPRADEPEKTVHYLSRFAHRAAADNAHAEAARALREALTHAEKLPAEQRDRRAVDVLLQLADSLLPLAHFPETLERCLEHEDRVSRLDDPQLTAPYQFWLAHTHTYLGNLEATREHAQRAIVAAEACGDETTLGKACYVLGRNGFWSGQFAEGIENSLRAVVLLERSGEPWWQGQAYWVAGFNHYVLGEIQKGHEALERAYEIGEALDDDRLDTSWSQGYFHASVGNWEVGIEKCRRGLERARDPLNLAVATGFYGYALLEKGDLNEAIAHLSDAIERLRATGMQQIHGWFATFLAEANLAVGAIEEARAHGEEGRTICQQADFRYGLGLALRTLGRVELAAEGQLEKAAEHLAQALDLFTTLAVPFEVGRTLLEQARLAQRRGGVEAARAVLEEAHDLFERLGIDAYVTQARTARSEQLGSAVPG